VGVSPSAGYEWLYRGWGTHPDRPPAQAYVAFARAVDAVFPGGFAERHEDEDEFAAVTGRSKDGQAAAFVDAQISDETESRAGFAEPPQNRCETGEAAGFSEFPESGEGFAEVFVDAQISDETESRAGFAEPLRTGAKQVRPQGFRSFRSRERGLRR